MLPAKTRRLKPAELSGIALMCFCVVLVISVPWVEETTSAQSPSTITDPKDAEAHQKLAAGDVLRAKWTAASLREAIDLYEKAALLWTSISDFRNASEATQKAGDIYFLLNEYAQALKQYENAETLAKKSGDWLAEARALSQMGRVQSYLGKNDLAQKQLSQSLAMFKSHWDDQSINIKNVYGEALSNLAEVSYSRGDFLNASKQFDSALYAFQNDRKGEARVRLFKGYIAGTIGDTNGAVAEIEHALRLYREINDKSGEGLALTAMGLWHASHQEYSRAIELHNEALALFRSIGDRHSEAVAFNAIGQGYQALPEPSNALAYFYNALKIFESTRALDATAGTTCAIAQSLGIQEQALATYQRCLQLSRNVGNLRIQAFALEGIARTSGAQGRRQLAAQYQSLERSFQSVGDLRGQAMALNAHGEFFLQIGEKQKALDVFSQAFLLTEKMSDKGTLIATLYNLARANEALGSHETALLFIRKSLKLIEEIRANVASPDFRASFFSAVRRHYDLYIEILMQLHRLRPGEGFAAEAFSVSEQGRARLLLDLLNESRANIRAGASRDLVERERRLRGLLRAQAEYQLNLSLSGKDSSELTEVADQIAQLRSDYQTVQAQLREKDPRLFSFEKLEPVDLERVQRELQGTDTMLLEYTLGKDHSYLWAVTSNSSESYILPRGREIEDAARELYEMITARQGRDSQSETEYQTDITTARNLYFEKASKLSRMLLGPVAEKLGSRRLVVVTDGALQYIPFYALPLPFAEPAGPVEAASTFLIKTNELVVLPSASTLLAIRGAQNHQSSTGKLVAIIADPVFSSTDERVQREAPASAVAKAAVNQNPDQAEPQTVKNLKPARLAHASEEADAISSVAPWRTTLVAKGFDASRETAMSPEVSQAQIVHFATHGFLDNKHPELSGIVLTMTDQSGAKTNGLMLLPDIYSLDLSAQLTVLSACQTALGKDIKGEGLVGLTHSFMSAGAKSVVASLWKVDDRATAALMAEFYKGMLEEGRTPAAALRSAQLKIMSEKQWSAPYYWAGFVLQGEYTNRIAVDRYSWLRRGLILLFLLILIAAALLILQKRRRRIRPAQFN